MSCQLKHLSTPFEVDIIDIKSNANDKYMKVLRSLQNTRSCSVLCLCSYILNSKCIYAGFYPYPSGLFRHWNNGKIVLCQYINPEVYG